MALPNVLKPKKQYLLERIGKNNDGGYLVSLNSILKSQILVSFEILDDTSFEKEFLKKNNIKNICYDHTLNKTYWKKKIFIDLAAAIYNLNFSYFIGTIKKFFQSKNFFKLKNVMFFNETITYGSVIRIFNEQKNKKSLFFKIDIEGSEYRILDELIQIQNFICGMIIEFHDVDLHIDKIVKFINDSNLTLTHIHPNNYGPTDKSGDPTVLELTFEKNPIEISNNVILPHHCDQPNNIDFQDIKLNFK